MKMNSIFKTPEGRQQIFDTYKEILSVWPVPNKQRLVETAYGSTFVIESGNEQNPAMILLHGSLSNSFSWFGDIARLSEQYHVTAVDLIGEPGSSAENRPSYLTGAYEQWLNELFDKLEIDTCTLVGLSLGGWMALRYATANPQRVNAMVLFCPGGLAPVKEDFMNEALRQKDQEPENYEQTIQKVMLDEAQSEGMKKIIEYITLIAMQTEPRTETLPVFSQSELSKLAMPILVVFGDSDHLLRAEESIENIKRSAADVHSVLLPNTGHAVIGQAERIMDFLNKIK